MFSGLRQNGLFYILEKGEDLKLRIGQVVSVSNPQPKYNQFGAGGFAAQPEMTVDAPAEKEAEKTVVFSVSDQKETATKVVDLEGVRENVKVYAPAEKTETEEFAFTTGLKITREPAGSAGATKSFSAVKERLKNASGEEAPATTKKQKKFF
jgi:hypothetical protein